MNAKLADWLLKDWLIDWLTTERLIDWLIDWLIGWLTDQLNDDLLTLPGSWCHPALCRPWRHVQHHVRNECKARWLIDYWKIDWLIDWLTTERLIDWLIGWLIDDWLYLEAGAIKLCVGLDSMFRHHVRNECKALDLFSKGVDREIHFCQRTWKKGSQRFNDEHVNGRGHLIWHISDTNTCHQILPNVKTGSTFAHKFNLY